MSAGSASAVVYQICENESMRNGLKWKRGKSVIYILTTHLRKKVRFYIKIYGDEYFSCDTNLLETRSEHKVDRLLQKLKLLNNFCETEEGGHVFQCPIHINILELQNVTVNGQGMLPRLAKCRTTQPKVWLIWFFYNCVILALSSQAFSPFGVGTFNLRVLQSCFSFMYFLITSLHLSLGLPIFQCPPTSIFHVLITTSSSVFLSTCPNHPSLASLIFSLMFATPTLALSSSVPIFSTLFIPIIILKIRVSVLPSKFFPAFLGAHVSLKYIRTGPMMV